MKPTDTSCEVDPVSVTVNTAESPSDTVTSLIASTGASSLSLIVPSPCGSPIEALPAFVRFTNMFSEGSSIESSTVLTVIVCVCDSPGLNVSVVVAMLP